MILLLIILENQKEILIIEGIEFYYNHTNNDRTSKTLYDNKKILILFSDDESIYIQKDTNLILLNENKDII